MGYANSRQFRKATKRAEVSRKLKIRHDCRVRARIYGLKRRLIREWRRRVERPSRPAPLLDAALRYFRETRSVPEWFSQAVEEIKGRL
jgi:hypothetical protein